MGSLWQQYIRIVRAIAPPRHLGYHIALRFELIGGVVTIALRWALSLFHILRISGGVTPVSSMWEE